MQHTINQLTSLKRHACLHISKLLVLWTDLSSSRKGHYSKEEMDFIAHKVKASKRTLCGNSRSSPIVSQTFSILFIQCGLRENWCQSQLSLGAMWTNIHTYIHTFKQIRVVSWPDLHVIALWEKTGLPGENLQRHRRTCKLSEFHQ